MAFSNSPGGTTIDYVDMGMPNSHFDMSTVHAYVTADMMSEFRCLSPPPIMKAVGSGFAVQMSLPIYAGESGSVHVTVGSISHVLYKDTTNPIPMPAPCFPPLGSMRSMCMAAPT